MAGANRFFWKEDEDEDDGYLSNWYSSPFTVHGVNYINVEQYLMVQKAVLFDESKIHEILSATSPRAIKELGRAVKNFDEDVWVKSRYNIMRSGLFYKFHQNTQLRKKLLSTGDDYLAEASPYDYVWGIGMSAGRAKSTPRYYWKGLNLLGRALMEVRDVCK
jgi:ribA/ribD-fused uncharacterized protein